MKRNPIRIAFALAAAMALCASHLPAQDDAPVAAVDCSAVQNDVKAKIAALDRADPDFQAKAVKIAEDAVTANPTCACEVFKGAADGLKKAEAAVKMAILDAIMALVPESQRQALGDCVAGELNSEEIAQMQDRWGIQIGEPGEGIAGYRLDGSMVYVLTPGARGGGGAGQPGEAGEAAEKGVTVSVTVEHGTSGIIIVPPPGPTSPSNPVDQLPARSSAPNP